MRRLVLLLAGLSAAACGSSHATPRRLHVADTYLGLDCGHSFPCPRLGIAIWLPAPERSVTVTLHGVRVRLATQRRYEYRRFWQGFVRDKVAEHLGAAADTSRTLRLSVEAIGRDGTVSRARLTSPVSPGWG